MTCDDLPDLTGGNRAMLDILENCMARGRALYDGHAVAAVADYKISPTLDAPATPEHVLDALDSLAEKQ